MLDFFYHHPGDDTVAHSLGHGSIRPTFLVPPGHPYNRALRGAFARAATGKLTQKPMPPSDSAPASRPGQVLCMDAHALPVSSAGGGSTWAHYVMDESCGTLDIVGSKSKHISVVLAAVHVQCSLAHSRPEQIHTDAESMYRYLKPAFGMAGIKMVCSTPGQHAQCIERYTHTVNERERITRDRLSYVLNPAYDIYLQANVANKMNSLVNLHSFYDTPDERRFHRRASHHYAHPFLSFGATGMVCNDAYRLTALAKRDGIPISKAPVSDLGVCMGSTRSSRAIMCLPSPLAWRCRVVP
jgi:hypothetical protein